MGVGVPVMVGVGLAEGVGVMLLLGVGEAVAVGVGVEVCVFCESGKPQLVRRNIEDAKERGIINDNSLFIK